MSYINIYDFLESGKRAIDEKNYWCALSMALMLPSICSRVEYNNNENYMNSNHQYKDKQCYVSWCQNNLCDDRPLINLLGPNYADILYNLRCDIVHAGILSIFLPGNKNILFSINKGNNATILEKYLVIDVKLLCNSIFNNVSLWLTNKNVMEFRETMIFDFTKNDDVLLYNKIVQDDRVKELYQDFNNYINKHK